MKAADAHALLITCPAPARALRDFGEALAAGQIEATATVIYNRGGQIHEGPNAKLQRYWRRIEASAQQGSVWTEGAAELPASGQAEAVRLTSIEFSEGSVETFVNGRRPSKPDRGRKRIQDQWTPFWMAAVKLGKVGWLNEGRFPTKAALSERLHTDMGATFDEQTIKPFVAMIYDEVVIRSSAELQTDPWDDD